jgi:DNA/RNA endonuclease YhcR with UshA esterase domain
MGGTNGRPVRSPAGNSVSFTFSFTAPYSYSAQQLSGVRAAAADLPVAFAPPVTIAVSGGAIPIGVARTLPPGQVVTIEGVATMYTGGFFAGSTGTKFYMEDESGGVQVYVPGGQGQVSVQIGELVQVTGELEYYRDSLEVIPLNIPADVVVTGETDPPPPAQITPSNDNEENDAVIGRLNQIIGTATRIEEFSFSYEIDLQDEAGDTTLVYIEKDTGITVETMEVGNRYRITGVSEFYSTRKQLKPRMQADIREIFPPVLAAANAGGK